MTKKVWKATCAAIVGCATAAIAQTTTPQPQTNTSPADRSNKVTIVGCLAAAPSSSAAAAPTGTAGATAPTATAGTAGTAGTAATAGTAGEATTAAASYQLTNAAPQASETAAAGATAPAETQTAPAAAGQTYRLIANPSALSPHVGKKLALTGTLEEAASSATAQPGSEPKAPALRVETGKVIAESCTPQ